MTVATVLKYDFICPLPWAKYLVCSNRGSIPCFFFGVFSCSFSSCRPVRMISAHSGIHSVSSVSRVSSELCWISCLNSAGVFVSRTDVFTKLNELKHYLLALSPNARTHLYLSDQSWRRRVSGCEVMCKFCKQYTFALSYFSWLATKHTLLEQIVKR